MLGDHLVFPILLSKDLERSRAFYHDTLGLEVARRDDDRIVFRCGSGSQLVVTLSTTGTSDTQTQLAWRVSDVRRSSRTCGRVGSASRCMRRPTP